MVIWEKALEHLRANTRVRHGHTMSSGDVNSSSDYVVLADGSFFIVRRNNLAAAKELLAAQKMVERRIAGH